MIILKKNILKENKIFIFALAGFVVICLGIYISGMKKFSYVYAETKDGKWTVWGYPAYDGGEWCGEMFYQGNSSGDIGEVEFSLEYNGKKNYYSGTGKPEEYAQNISVFDEKVIQEKKPKVYDLWEFGGMDVPDVKITIKWREKGKNKREVLKLKEYSVRKFIGDVK